MRELRKEIYRAVTQAIARHHIHSGKPFFVKKLEKRLASFFGSPAVGVASGTDALILVMKALGIGCGDEIIVPAFSFISTASSVAWVGAKPIFVDIRIDDCAMNPQKIEEKINPKTKAIILVHLFGKPALGTAKILKIAKNHRIFLIEDAAQSFGAKFSSRLVGTIGDAGCFSFSSTKPLGAYGNGGAVVSKNKRLINAIKLMRSYGGRRPYREIRRLGVNASLDDIQAAIILVKLKWKKKILSAYTDIAKKYGKELFGVGDLKLFFTEGDDSRVWYRYPVRTTRRNTLFNYLIRKLRQEKLLPMINYPVPLPYLSVFKKLGHSRGEFPVSEKISREILALPMSIFMEKKDLYILTRIIKQFFIQRYKILNLNHEKSS